MELTRVLFLSLCQAVSGFSSVSDGRDGDALVPAPVEGVPRVLLGRVELSDGSPAEGVLVFSDAGGRAVVDADGLFRLEVRVPLETTSLQVTAMGPGGNGRMASRRVALGTTAKVVPLDPLTLAFGGSCSPDWLPRFGPTPAANGTVFALEVLDDGNGPALYAGGDFTVIGGVAARHVARWNGAGWEPLGEGIFYPVRALAFWDGNIRAGTVVGVWRWTGSLWAQNGAVTNGQVSALAVFDDGTGEALYAGGSFSSAGGAPIARIARWDGTAFSAVGSNLGIGQVHALQVFDDGSGPALYAAGFLPGGVRRWDGTTWTGLGTGLFSNGGGNGSVYALAEFDDGTGPALYAAGRFDLADGQPAPQIARWDGSAWGPVGAGFFLPLVPVVYSLEVFDEGSGPRLFAGGLFNQSGGVPLNHIAAWDGTSWSARGVWMNNAVRAMAAVPAAGGAALFVGGDFTFTLDGEWGCIARWSGASWVSPAPGLDGYVYALARFDAGDGTGDALYVAGEFRRAGDLPLRGLARWSGHDWSSIGALARATGEPVGSVLGSFDLGSGPALYLGGSFDHVGGVAASGVARWDGVSWAPLGSGGQHVHALEVMDDGNGAVLYAAGDFLGSAGASARSIARWDGVSWSALGAGVSGGVLALKAFDDGNGPSLFATGTFTQAGGTSAARIARWDGTQWHPLGTGLDGPGHALAVFPNPVVPRLFVGGDFVSAGGRLAPRIATWNGTSWASGGELGGGGPVLTLLVHGEDDGLVLDAGGGFTGLLARLRPGSSWTPLSGITSGTVLAIEAFGDAGGQLHVGGTFSAAGAAGDSFLASRGCPDVQPPTLDLPAGPLWVADRIGSPAGEVVRFSVSATDDFDPTPEVQCTPPSGSVFPPGRTRVFCTAEDAAGNVSTGTFEVVVVRGVH